MSPRAGRGTPSSLPKAAPTSAAGNFEMKYLGVRSLAVYPQHARSLASAPGSTPFRHLLCEGGLPGSLLAPHQLFFPVRTCSFQVSWGYPAAAGGEPGVPEEVDAAPVRAEETWRRPRPGEWRARASGLASLYSSSLHCVCSVPNFDALLIRHSALPLGSCSSHPPF